MCISGAVGRAGRNGHDDAKTVQILLNLSGNAIGLVAPLVEDGIVGTNTLAAIEKFQRQVLGMPSPSVCVDPQSATLLRLRGFLGEGFNKAKLNGVMINAPEPNLLKYVNALSTKMQQREMTTPMRQAYFLAQIGHESGELRYVEEIVSGRAYEGRADLGNTEPGDGVRTLKGEVLYN